MSTFALRQTYPFTQHIGVESVLQRDAGHRGARLRTGGNHVVFKGLGVTFALRRRIDYAYFVHDRCPLKNRWTLSNQEHIGSRCDGRTVTEESPIVGAEEYAIHDYEGFCGYSVGEFDAIEELREVAVFLSEFTEFGGVLLSFAGNLVEARRIAEEGYCGLYNSLARYAQELTEECGDVPEHLAPYIDYQLMGRDLELNGNLIALEIGFEKVHIFHNV